MEKSFTRERLSTVFERAEVGSMGFFSRLAMVQANPIIVRTHECGCKFAARGKSTRMVD
jgi:hypothetical protein